MVEKARHPIKIDLNQFKLHVDVKNKIALTLHFNSPSRRFYLSLIAFVVNEMKKRGKIIPIHMEEHLDLLALLNESVGGSAGSSEKENLLPRIYRKWHLALPNLEEAPLFKVLGRQKGYGEGIGKIYPFTEEEKDCWANLFEYIGSEENVRLKFAIDKIGAGLDDVVILFEDSLNEEAWERFVLSLKGKTDERLKTEDIEPILKEPEAPVSPNRKWKITWASRYRWVALIAAVIVVLGAITLAIWKTYLNIAPVKVASVEKMAFPLPDKPSIVVLPFVNMSDDPKQEFFSDGITEEIINALSRVPQVFVIARHSSFNYKGKSIKVQQVAEEMGVRYVMEGSIHREGNRVRIMVQFIDALTGLHLFSERYDREARDFFHLHDDIAMKILTAVRVKLSEGEAAHMIAKGTKNLDAYLKIMQARELANQYNKETNILARQLTEQAISLDPGYAFAYASLAYTHFMDVLLGASKNRGESIERGIELAQKAIAMDESLERPHGILSLLYILKRDYDKAIIEAEKALALEPNSALAHHTLGTALLYAGRHEEAIPFFKKAVRFGPIPWSITLLNMASCYRMMGQYEEALVISKKLIQSHPDHLLGYLGLTATYSLMGRREEARAAFAEVLRIDPKFSLEDFAKNNLYKNEADWNRGIDALRKAGLK